MQKENRADPIIHMCLLGAAVTLQRDQQGSVGLQGRMARWIPTPDRQTWSDTLMAEGLKFTLLLSPQMKDADWFC